MKIFGILSAAFVAAALVVSQPVLAAESAEETLEVRTFSNSKIEALGSNDELFSGYVDSLFLGESGDFTLLGDYGESRFEGVELEIYREIKKEVQSVAAGERETTSFSLSPNWTCTYEELGVEPYTDESGVMHIDKTAIDNALWAKIQNVSFCVMMDCPYDMYWYDKTTGASFGWAMNSYTTTGFTITAFKVTYYVEEDYQAADETGEKSNTTVDSSKVAAAKTAAENAKATVEENKSGTDREKLTAYYERIRELSDYNDDAAADANMPYGDPWQLIYVFDGDPETKVVCEGFAKAFQYLCDMSDFEDAACYTVGGNLASASVSGEHLWNVVTLDGVNTLCDITNGVLLLDANGMIYSGSDGYIFYKNGYKCTYSYNAKTLALYDEAVLTLGKYAESVKLNAESLEIRPGETALLEATVEPADAIYDGVEWTSSDTSVATVENGVVTAISVGEAVIEAKAGEVSAVCTVTVCAAEPEITSVTVKRTDGAVVVTIEFDNPTGGRVLAAGYGQDGEMVDLKGVSGNTAELSNDTESVKIFLWNSLSGMVPLCDSVEGKINN